jgi:predicted acylesterase/phospholipase RssA
MFTECSLNVHSGASAGSIVAALVACKTEPELEKMFIPSCYENWSMLGSLEVSFYYKSNKLCHHDNPSDYLTCVSISMGSRYGVFEV